MYKHTITSLQASIVSTWVWPLYNTILGTKLHQYRIYYRQCLVPLLSEGYLIICRALYNKLSVRNCGRLTSKHAEYCPYTLLK